MPHWYYCYYHMKRQMLLLRGTPGAATARPFSQLFKCSSQDLDSGFLALRILGMWTGSMPRQPAKTTNSRNLKHRINIIHRHQQKTNKQSEHKHMPRQHHPNIVKLYYYYETITAITLRYGRYYYVY